MGHLEQQLIDKATRKHKKIYPCAHKENIDECFTRDDGRLMLWFNTEDQSTHVVTQVLRKTKRKKLDKVPGEISENLILS